MTCNPFGRRICCDVDPDEVSAVEPDDDEAEAARIGDDANRVGLVQEEISIAERRFGILVDSHDDCLDVVVAPSLTRG